MTKEPTRAERLAKERGLALKAKNSKARQDAAAYRALERARSRTARTCPNCGGPSRNSEGEYTYTCELWPRCGEQGGAETV